MFLFNSFGSGAKKQSKSSDANEKNSINFEAVLNFVESITASCVPSIINQGAKVSGEVRFDACEVFGGLDGQIKANLIHIRHGGAVVGEILADQVKISGNFDGKINARIVHFLSGSHIKGEVHYGFLIVEDGVVFNGSCNYKPSLLENPEVSIVDAS